MIYENTFISGLFEDGLVPWEMSAPFVLSEDVDSILEDFFDSNYDWEELVKNNEIDNPEVKMEWIRRITSATGKGLCDWKKYTHDYGNNIWKSFDGECILSSEKVELSLKQRIYSGKKVEKEYSLYIRTGEYEGAYFSTEYLTEGNQKEEIIEALDHLVSQIDIAIDNNGVFLQGATELATKKIEYSDVLVIAHSLVCRKADHEITPYKGIVPLLDKENNISDYTIYIGYCRNCYCYYMFESDYIKMLKVGRPLCRICEIQEKIEDIKKGQFHNLKSESILTAFGYTVQAGSELSDDERRRILIAIVSKQLLSVHEVVDFLNWLVRTRTLEKYKIAVEKWKSDIEFIEDYAMKNADILKIEKITVKKKQ